MTENQCTAHGRAARAPEGDDMCKHTRNNTHIRESLKNRVCVKSHFQNHKDSDREMAISSTHITLIEHLQAKHKNLFLFLCTNSTDPASTETLSEYTDVKMRLTSKHASRRHVPDEFHLLAGTVALKG